MLTLSSPVISPRLVTGGVGAWKGLLEEAFRLDGDTMTARLEALCGTWEIEVYDKHGDPRDDGDLLGDLARAGAGDREVAAYLLDDPGVLVLDAWRRLAWRNDRDAVAVHVETWDPDLDEFEPTDDAEEVIPDGEDLEDDVPYVAAEERLLARTGLVRDHLADTYEPW